MPVAVSHHSTPQRALFDLFKSSYFRVLVLSDTTFHYSIIQEREKIKKSVLKHSKIIFNSFSLIKETHFQNWDFKMLGQ